MIAIVDYGMGNLRSVQKAFARLGHPAQITSDPHQVAQASKVVLPGVGAFADAMHNLRAAGLVEPLLEAIEREKPFLGICLGLQLLFQTSYEDGEHQGLGVIPGRVVRFELPPQYKVPHMGWNQLEIRRRTPMLEGVASGTFVYFVHSYYVQPEDEQVVATVTDYGGPFVSMIARGRLQATQFHPEKSQQVGLAMLDRFARMPD